MQKKFHYEKNHYICHIEMWGFWWTWYISFFLNVFYTFMLTNIYRYVTKGFIAYSVIICQTKTQLKCSHNYDGIHYLPLRPGIIRNLRIQCDHPQIALTFIFSLKLS